MKNKPQFACLPWYPRDFASATRTWPLVARGVFRELLDCQWDCGGLDPGILPADPQQLRELVRATPADWRKAWPWVEPKFPTVPMGGRQNPRLEQHRKAAVRKYLGRRRAASLTNAKLGRGNGVLTDTVTDTVSVSHEPH